LVLLLLLALVLLLLLLALVLLLLLLLLLALVLLLLQGAAIDYLSGLLKQLGGVAAARQGGGDVTRGDGERYVTNMCYDKCYKAAGTTADLDGFCLVQLTEEY
jgi:hypothetical protein